MPLAMTPVLDDGVSHDIVEWLISPSSFSGHAIIVQYKVYGKFNLVPY